MGRGLNLNGSIVRGDAGSAFLITLLVAGFITFSVGFLYLQCHTLVSNKARVDAACQAAALAASADLSRIVIEDPEWGYISLSDYPASGAATVAEDGEPLPVLGINTILGITRLECLLAERLANPEMKRLAQADADSARKAAQRLGTALAEAIKEPHGSNKPARDPEGRAIHPYRHAREVFLSNLGKAASPLAVRSFNLSLGYLTTPGQTVTPQPVSKGGTSDGRRLYKSFQNYPVEGKSFYFAGVGSQPHLVDSSRFAAADAIHVSSAVRSSAVVAYVVATDTDSPASYTISGASVAIPFSNPDKSASGSLVVHFPQGTTAKISNLVDALELDRVRQNEGIPPRVFSAQGDFPGEAGSRLAQKETGSGSAAQVLARALLDWMRTAHCRTDLDSLIEALRRPFGQTARSSAGNLLSILDFDRSGRVVSTAYRDGGFLRDTVADRQEYSSVSRVLETERGSLAVTVRDQVRVFDVTAKHGGQPLPDELPRDYEVPSAAENDVVIPSRSGSTRRLRRSYYKGGLAVAVEFSFAP